MSELDNNDIEAINKDIEDAKNKLVSKDTEAKILQAKEEAKKEAAKEFEVNARIKELEEDKKKLQESIELKEKEAAEKIANLAQKVNNYVESKAVINKQNSPLDKTIDLDKVSDEDIDKIEQESFNAFINEKVRKSND
jgi:hypothetical protein